MGTDFSLEKQGTIAETLRQKDKFMSQPEELLRRKIDLDPGTHQLIGDRMGRAARPDQDFINEHLAGTEAGGVMNDATAQATQERNTALGGAQPDIREALRRRSNKSFGQSLESLGAQAKALAPARRSQLLSSTTKMALGFENQQAEEHKKASIADANKQRMKNQALSGVLGIAGGIIGAIFGGGAGAAGGKQAGSSVVSNTSTEKV